MRDAAKVALPYTPVIGVLTGAVPGVIANTVLSTGAAYVDGVEAQANAMREVAATEILERLNGGLNELSAGVNTLTQTGISGSTRGTRRTIPILSDDTATNLDRGYVNVSTHDSGVYGRSADDDYGRVGLRSDKSLYPDGYADPETDEFARHRALVSQQVSKRYLPPDVDGSYDRPITNPQDLMGMDLMHTRVDANHHRNGVVWGGHVPANPTASITRCGALMEGPLLITVLPGASLGSARLEPVPLGCVVLHAWEQDHLAFRERLL